MRMCIPGKADLEKEPCLDTGERDQVLANLPLRARNPTSILGDPAQAWISAEQIVG